MAHRATSIGALRQQVRALRNRVAWLERALKQPQKPAAVVTGDANRARQRAETTARNKVFSEYVKKRRIQFYRDYPETLARDLASEQELNRFFRSRGLKPEPSMIPEEVKKMAKAPRRG